ncbi:MAG TPA: cytochrome P450 [Amycolatopsis sp.]|nr:cytochrome P450 [Amycolatopsis sp.]
MAEKTTMPVHIRRDGFDPDPGLAELRRECPVSRVDLVTGGSGWLVTRYDDARAVLGDPDRFPSHPNAFIAQDTESPAGPPPGFLLSYNPPEHTRLRRMLAPAFTAKRMRRLRPRVEEMVSDQLDAIERAGAPADLVPMFTLPIPSLAICELLGVPYADRAAFQDRSVRRTDFAASLEQRAAAFAETQAYLAELVAAQRATPGDDILGMLVREHGDTLSDPELTGVADLLLIAGHDTTAHMLALGILLLLNHPGHVAKIHDEATIEEMLRYLSVVHSGIPRVARENAVLGGQLIEAGDWVVCSLPSANRDETLGPEPGRFDPDRRIPGHIAFGHGIHHCLGAPLARMELGIAYPALFRRFPDLRLAVPPEDVRFHSHSVVYGVESLPVAW